MFSVQVKILIILIHVLIQEIHEDGKKNWMFLFLENILKTAFRYMKNYFKELILKRF